MNTEKSTYCNKIIYSLNGHLTSLNILIIFHHKLKRAKNRIVINIEKSKSIFYRGVKLYNERKKINKEYFNPDFDL